MKVSFAVINNLDAKVLHHADGHVDVRLRDSLSFDSQVDGVEGIRGAQEDRRDILAAQFCRQVDRFSEKVSAALLVF